MIEIYCAAHFTGITSEIDCPMPLCIIRTRPTLYQAALYFHKTHPYWYRYAYREALRLRLHVHQSPGIFLRKPNIFLSHLSSFSCPTLRNMNLQEERVKSERHLLYIDLKYRHSFIVISILGSQV